MDFGPFRLRAKPLFAVMLICPLERMEGDMFLEEGSQIVWELTTILLGVFAGLTAYLSVMNFPGMSSMLLAVVGGAAMSAAMITSHLFWWPL